MVRMQTRRMFKFRVYPSKEQQNKIDNTIEVCRRTYNELRDYRIETYEQTHKGLGKYDLNGCMMHMKSERPQMVDVHSHVLQNTSDRLTKAFNNMFARIKRGERKKGFPRYKKPHKYKSFCYPDSGFKIKNNKLYLSKIGMVNIKLHRGFDSKKDRRKLVAIKTLTISKVPSGKYFASFSCVVEIEQIHKEVDINNAVGLDMGLKEYATMDDGISITNPRFYRKSEQRLAHLQRVLSRKKFRSHNYHKANIKVARLHEHIANQRYDYTNQLSSRIAKKYSFIGVESLNIRGMAKNKNISKSILDAGWGQFISQLRYKVSNTGGVVQEIDRFYPSSKTCSSCGHIQDMPLNERTYHCGGCGCVIDRDHNASINIKNEALRVYLDTVGATGINACGDATSMLVQSGLMQVVSVNQEAPQFIGV